MVWEIFVSSLDRFNHVVIGYYVLVDGINTALLLVSLWIAVRYFRKMRSRIDYGSLPHRSVPPVSLIRVTFNESSTVVESIRSLLNLNYPEYEVVVIDDGSSDSTLKLLVEAFDLKPLDYIYRRVLSTSVAPRGLYVSGRSPRLIVVEKEHSGKADSLNVGINLAQNPYFCPVDADTLLERDALRHLVRPILEDPDRIVASGGIMRIANGSTIQNGQVIRVDLPADALSLFQIVEQIRCILFGQVGWAALHCLWGSFRSFSLFQKKAVLKLGGYDTQSVRADMDLMIRLNGLALERKRYCRVVMVMDQVAWSQSPRRLNRLAWQRRNWYQGLVESLFSHLWGFLRLRYGALRVFLLPLYTIIKLLGPMVEIGGYVTIGLAWALGVLTPQLMVLFLFLAFFYGTFLSLNAVLLEEVTYRRYPAWSHFFRLLFYAAIENFAYRQLNSWWRLEALGQSLLCRRQSNEDKQSQDETWMVKPRFTYLVWISFSLIIITTYLFYYSGFSVQQGQKNKLIQQVQAPLEQGQPEKLGKRPEKNAADGLTSAKARLETARSLANIGQLDAAIREYEQLVVLDPQNRALQEEFAWALIKTSQFDRAVTVYDKLLEKNSTDIDLHLRKAMALYGAGDLRGAIREYKSVLELDPSNIEAKIALQELHEVLPKPFHLVMGVLLSVVLIIVLISFGILAFRRSRSGGPFSSPHWGERYIHMVAIISLIVAAYYIVWRATSTINWEAWLFSIPVLLAELYGVIVASMFFLMAWHPTKRTPPPPLAGRTVDIFITTYDEDPGLLRKTILGCLAITYPHITYVLDDGNRPEVAQLARELGCEYIAREQNINAKAGNLNNALRVTSGEFIVTLDADHVPLPHFVDRLIGYFRDEKVAFVQTPQDFYNVDSFQHRLDKKSRRMWTEQSLFFSVIQPGKDYWNSAFYCGTCAILRRSALVEVGGFAEGTITEDIHTSLLLHAKGYKSVYQNESLAYGVAAETARPFHVQRLRWGQGAMQVFVRGNPLWIKGLTIPQRISYLASMTTYFDGFQKLIYYLAPVIYFLTGILPIQAFDIIFLLHFVPYLTLFLLSFELMSRGCGSTWYTEEYNMAKFATFMKTSLGLFIKKRLHFSVTPKSREQQTPYRLLYPQMLILSLNLAGIGIGTFRYVWKADLEVLAYWGNLFWAAWNTGLALTIIHFSLNKVQLRSTYRFPYLLPCNFHILKDGSGPIQLGLIQDCHETGASLITSLFISKGTDIDLSSTVGQRIVPVEGTVIHSGPENLNGPALFKHGIRFTRIAQEDQHYLIKYSFTFSVPKFMKTYDRPQTLFERLESYLRYEQRRANRYTLSLLTTIRFHLQGKTHQIVAVTEDISDGGLMVICHEKIPLSVSLNFTIQFADRQIQGEGKVLRGDVYSFGDFKIYRHVIQFQKEATASAQSFKELRSLLYLAKASR